MTDRHSRDDDNNQVDELLSGADEDLQTSLDAALDVDSGLAAALATPIRPTRVPMPTSPPPLSGPRVNAHGQISGRIGGGFGPATTSGFGRGPGLGSGRDAAAAGPEPMTAGRRGAGGMGAAAMRGEDREFSSTKYLVDADSDEIFRTDIRSAPPVIGE